MISNNAEEPLISVLIPAYNHEKYILRTLDSILEDNYKNLELVIIDDGSIDQTPAVIEDWISRHPEAKAYFRSRPNVGIAKTMNELIDLARGEYLRPFSSDDILKQGSLRAMLAELVRRPSLYAVAGDCEVIDSNGQVTSPSVLNLNRSKAARINSDEDLKVEIISRWSFGGPCILLSRKAYDKFGIYNPDSLIDDWDLYLRLTAGNALAFIPIVVAQYRVHTSNMSRTRDSSLRIRNLGSQRMIGLSNLGKFSEPYKTLLKGEVCLLDAKIAFLKRRLLTVAYYVGRFWLNRAIFYTKRLIK